MTWPPPAAMSAAWTKTLGWALLHFVWQGAAIAVLFLVSRALMRGRSPAARYAAACLALSLLAASPLVTAAVLAWPPTPPPALPVIAITPAPLDEPPPTPPDQPLVNPALQAPPTLPPAPPIPAFTTPRRFVPLSATSTAALWQSRLESLFPWLVPAWLLAVPLLTLRLVVGWSQALRWSRRHVAAVGESITQTTADLARRLGLRQAVRVLRSALVGVPMVVGWLRPVILIPAAALAQLTPAQVEAILAHELAHIRRHDALINLAQCLIETLLFYHPAVWWVSNVIRQERELCCDDEVLRLGLAPGEYAAALLGLEEARAHQARLAVAASGGKLLARVRRILAVPQPPRSQLATWLTAGAAVVILLIALVACGLVGGQTPAPKAPATAPTETKVEEATPAPPPIPLETQADLARNALIAAKLRQPIPMSFTKNKLSGVLDYFMNSTGLDLDIRWPQLAEAGVKPDSPVTAQFNAVPADVALAMILEGLSPPHDAHLRLGYAIVKGKVKVSTHADLASLENLTLRVYDVGDLVNVPGLPPNAGARDAAKTREAALDRIKAEIRETVGVSEDWAGPAKGTSTIDDFIFELPLPARPDAGPGRRTSAIDDFKFKLLVRTTESNHLAIFDLLALLRTCAAAGPAPVPYPVPPESDADARAHRELQKTLAINFDANKLSDVLEYFANSTGLDINARWDRLEEAGVTPNAPVTARFASISAEKALRAILDNLSPAKDRPLHLTYAISDGTLTISTHQDLASPRWLELRAYDVRALISPGLTPEQLTARVCRDAGIMEDWRNGIAGGFSTITEFGGFLLIRTTAANHADVRRLLPLIHQDPSIIAGPLEDPLNYNIGRPAGVGATTQPDAPTTSP